MRYVRIPLRVPRDADELLPCDSKLRSAIVDECFEEFLGGFSWHLRVSGTVHAYSRTGNKNRYMHSLVKPSPANLEVDHAGCNALDDRWSSLRWATRKQNVSNMRMPEGAASAYKGVKTNHENWAGQIALKHLPKHMTAADGAISCTHASELHCALWYEAVARQVHGEWHNGSFNDVSDAALLGAAMAEGVDLVDASNPGESQGSGNRRRIYNTLAPEAWLQRVAEKRKADKAEMLARDIAAFDYAKIHGLPGHPIRERKVTLEELQGDMQ